MGVSFSSFRQSEPPADNSVPDGYVLSPTALSIDYSVETNRYRNFTSRAGFSNWNYDGTNDWLETTAHSFALGIWNYSYQDQKITATVRLNNPSGASDDDVRLICRYQSSEDDYYALLLEPTADIVRLRKTTSAGVTTLQEIHEAGLAVDTDYTVVLQCYGPIIRASIAELSLNLGAIDFDLTSGSCGMGSNGCYIRVKSVTCDVADEITISSSVVWPDSGTTTIGSGHAIRAPLWYRAFAPHSSSPDVTSTVDCHLGADIGGQSSRDPVYAVMGGIVNRPNESFCGFRSSDQYTRLFNTSGAGTFTLDTSNGHLRMTSLGNSSTFASGAMKLSFKHTPSPTVTGGGEDNIDLRVQFTDTIPSDYQGGIYMWEDSTHFARIYLDEFSGNLVCSYRNGGSETTINSASIPANLNALRLVWDTSAGTVRGYYATDGGAAIDSWTAWGSSTTVGFDADLELGVFLANPESASPDNNWDIEDAGYFWQLMIGGRFGNYAQFTSRDPRNPTTAALTWAMVHMDELLVSPGQVIAAGELIGYVGKTGFNSRSGPVLSNHIHWEASAGSYYYYDNTRPINILAPSIMPRDNVDNNVTITVTDTPDPDATASFRVRVTQSREDNDFDVNQLAFVGASGNQTINFNDRTGIWDDVSADRDENVQGNVYIACSSFDEDDDDKIVDYYCHKSHFGASMTSVTVFDTEGTTLATWTP